MDIAYLQEFIILANILNISKAADELRISQPTLSRHLLAMEEQIGTQLVVRSSHCISLTTAGQMYLDRVTRLVIEHDQLLADVRRLENRETLTIGIQYYHKNVFISRIEQFQGENPNATINIIISAPYDLLKGVLDGNIDLCSTARIDLPQDIVDQLCFVDIYSEPLTIMTAKRHPLATHKLVSPAEIVRESIICTDDAFFRAFYRCLRGLFRAVGLTMPEPVLVPHPEQMLMAVQAGEGITILSANMMHYPSNGTVIEIDDPSFQITRSLAYRADNTNPLIRGFLQLYNRFTP